MKMLEVRKVYKEYEDLVAVDGISLTINKGEIFGILGPNGAGKSTLIGMICGLIKKTSGEIIYEEETNKIKKWKENIGVVPQDFALYWDLTAEENIKFFCSLYGFKGKDLKERTEKSLEFVGLTEVRNKKASEFSGGMKRRLNIGCAIAHSPKLIIMDEPFVGLDPKAAHLLKGMMREKCEEGGAIFFSTHVLEVAEKLCDKVAIIKNGVLIRSGTMDEVKGDTSLEDVFLELEGEKC